MAQISVKNFAETDLQVFLDMSKSEYGPSDTTTNPEHIKWKHLDSPFGVSAYVCLTEMDKVVGRALIQPRLLRTASKVFDAASVMDLLVDKAHRSTPISFLNLTKASGIEAGFDLIYHTSNERTFPLYSKLLKFASPFSLRAYGFPVRFAGLLASIIGRRFKVIDWFTAPLRWLLVFTAYAVNSVACLNFSQKAINDDELEVLCTKCLRKSGPHLARTNAFLKWRFSDAPLWPGTLYRIDKKGQFLGYVVTRNVELGDLNHLVLIDFMLDTDTPFIALVALRMWLICKAISSKSDVLFTMANPFSTIAEQCLGFPLIHIPDKFLPHVTPIFIRSRTDESKDLEVDQSIHLTLADLDYF
jgi:hypothetical protein